MPLDKRWECALVHERRAKKTTSSSSASNDDGIPASTLHVKGDIKNKQAHLAVLMKKVEELKAEIESLEQQQASAPPSLTKEKIANETRQEAKLDKEKLADLIDLGPAENESPSLDDVLERKLLAFRARGPHKWVGDTDCPACPAAAFCPNASIRPTQCPAGTFTTGLAKAEEDCEVCPPGFKCSQPAVTDFEQSSVSREPDGSSVGGSSGPESCPEDNTTIHFSFPNITGCVENCPYQFERQSYCHKAGDGRVPDRTATAVRVEQLIDLRGPRGVAVRDQALADLVMILGNLTAEELRRQLLIAPGKTRKKHLIVGPFL
eukprot:s3535_g3.t1